MKRVLSLAVVCALSASASFAQEQTPPQATPPSLEDLQNLPTERPAPPLLQTLSPSLAPLPTLLPGSTEVSNDQCTGFATASALSLPGHTDPLPVTTVGHGLRNKVLLGQPWPGYCATLMVTDPDSYNKALGDSSGDSERKAISGMDAAVLRIDVRFKQIFASVVRSDFQGALYNNFGSDVVTASKPLQAFLSATTGAGLNAFSQVRQGDSIIIAWDEKQNTLYYQQTNGNIETIAADPTSLDQVLAIWLGKTDFDAGLDGLKKALLTPAPAASAGQGLENEPRL